ncbi:MAG: phosphatase PAP2 family protein [Janthinobacterium lividum]
MTRWQGWAGVTDLADQAVVLPLALLVGVALLSRGRGGRRAAAGWALAVGGVLAGLLALKLWAGACSGAGVAGGGGVLRDVGLRSPSGHTAAGGIVYGGLLALALRRGAGGAALCCLAVAAGFGASRLALGVHTPADVAVGCAVAAAGGAVLARVGGWRGGGAAAGARGGGAGAGFWAWGAAALALVWVLHGRRLGAEPVITAVATHWLRPLCGW